MSSIHAQPECKAAELVGALLDAGEAIDEGSFTLDPAAAAAKLAEFRYADRTLLLIPIVEGLFRLGATRVEVETNPVGRRLRVRATGITLPEPERSLANLHAYGLAQPRDPLEQALRRLVIGLDMALAEDLADRAQIACGSACFELRSRQAPVAIARAPLPTDTLELILSNPRPWWKARARVLEHLRAAVRHARVVAIIDSRQVSGHPREWFATETAEGPGFRVFVGLEQREDTDGLVELWTAGICVERRSWGGFASRAVIELDAPRRDLCQLAIVDDPVVEQALAVVDWARASVLEQLEHAEAGWTAKVPRVPEWPPERVDRALGRVVRGDARRVQQTRLAGGSLFFEAGFDPPGAGLAFCLGFFSAPGLLSAPSFFSFSQLGSSVVYAVSGLLIVTLCGPTLWALYTAVAARNTGETVEATITTFEVDRLHRATHGTNDVVRISWTFHDHNRVLRTGHSFRRPRLDALHWGVGEKIVVYYHRRNPNRSWWQADIGPR
jgi:hypothetical protein